MKGAFFLFFGNLRQAFPNKTIGELKQTDAAAVNRQISIQIQSDGCQGSTEFTWP